VIIGHGFDAVEVGRIRRALERHHGFATRVYSERELAASARRGAGAVAYLARRWAAKEAAAKALGVGFSGFRYPEIEVGNRRSGAPELLVSGEFAAWAERVGVRAWHVSLSDTRDLALASVIAEGEPPEDEPGAPPWVRRRLAAGRVDPRAHPRAHPAAGGG
jgi:holo-[acyl-carrier protein] synthase